MSKAFLKRQKAKMYVAMAYRNQEYLEDYHVSGKALNEEAYEKMHAVVNQAIMEYSDTINTALTVYGKSREELVGIHNIDIAGALISALMVDAWDDPIKVRERMKEQDVAEFILSGVFRKKCLSAAILTDSVMCEINHDVYNRVFTLVCRGIL